MGTEPVKEELDLNSGLPMEGWSWRASPMVNGGAWAWVGSFQTIRVTVVNQD